MQRRLCGRILITWRYQRQSNHNNINIIILAKHRSLCSAILPISNPRFPSFSLINRMTANHRKHSDCPHRINRKVWKYSGRTRLWSRRPSPILHYDKKYTRNRGIAGAMILCYSFETLPMIKLFKRRIKSISRAHETWTFLCSVLAQGRKINTPSATVIPNLPLKTHSHPQSWSGWAGDPSGTHTPARALARRTSHLQKSINWWSTDF